jgi:hypothetical protein
MEAGRPVRGTSLRVETRAGRPVRRRSVTESPPRDALHGGELLSAERELLRLRIEVAELERAADGGVVCTVPLGNTVPVGVQRGLAAAARLAAEDQHFAVPGERDGVSGSRAGHVDREELLRVLERVRRVRRRCSTR